MESKMEKIISAGIETEQLVAQPADKSRNGSKKRAGAQFNYIKQDIVSAKSPKNRHKIKIVCKKEGGKYLGENDAISKKENN
jgi:hypothetical protein